MASTVTYHREESIGVVTFRRPEKLNAINSDFKDQLIECLEAAQIDSECKVVLVEAEGRAFSVGFDIDHAVDESTVRDPFHWERILRKSLNMDLTPWRMEKPVIAAVQGYVLGGGCEFAMMCDLTIASDDAMFGEPEIRFSHVGPVMVMPWMVGLKRAKELIFFGDPITANEALSIGMINKVVPRQDLPAKARQYARKLTLISPEALRWAKRTINRSAEQAGLTTSLEAGVDAYVALYAGQTAVNKEFGERSQREGLKAALAWRAQQFREFDI